jgi:hypothetical protein
MRIMDGNMMYAASHYLSRQVPVYFLPGNLSSSTGSSLKVSPLWTKCSREYIQFANDYFESSCVVNGTYPKSSGTMVADPRSRNGILQIPVTQVTQFQWYIYQHHQILDRILPQFCPQEVSLLPDCILLNGPF